MAIEKNIEKQFKEKSGSLAKNRLTVQLSFAIKMLVDFYPVKNFVVFLDCVEDVAVHTIDEAGEKIYLYQIKTKNTNGDYTLTNVIKKSWLQKLYKHKHEFRDDDVEIALVVDDFIWQNKDKVFVNEKQELNLIATENLLLIKKAISNTENEPIDAIDLSKFYFIKTGFHIDTHQEQAKELLSKFILKRDGKAQAAKINAFYSVLSQILDSRFNCELDPRVTDINEIVSKKGYKKAEFNSALKDFMHESIPQNTELFSLLSINSIPEQKELSSMRSRFLMDLSSSEQSFKKFLDTIDKYLSQANLDKDFLKNCCDNIMANPNVSPIYKDIAYVKFAIAYQYFNYINGDINEKISF